MPTAALATTHRSNPLSRQKVLPSVASGMNGRGPIPHPVGIPLFLEPKLAMSQLNDLHEQEAGRVADPAIRMPEPAVQRQCPVCAGGGVPCLACDQEESMRVLRKAEGAGGGDAPVSVHSVIRSPGNPLSEYTRGFFEPRLGCDLGHVRVHTGVEAGRSARDVHALAYTVGSHVVFRDGLYTPGTSDGQRLLAHELTHVIQQEGVARRVQRFSTQDCDSEDIARIDASHNRAIALVKAAIARLTADPVTAETKTHFTNHFGGYGEWRRGIVVDHFKRDLQLLTASEMTYECESECDEGEPAYTYWVFGDIHVCLPWLRSQVLTERGETFVHEMHHWDVPRGHLDLGYHKNNQDNQTTWVVAVNNADAYSELAQDLYEQP